MYFGENKGYGIPFYLNGEIVGWVCTTVDNLYIHVLAGHSNVKSYYKFKTELQCKLDLMKVFGE